MQEAAGSSPAATTTINSNSYTEKLASLRGWVLRRIQPLFFGFLCFTLISSTQVTPQLTPGVTPGRARPSLIVSYDEQDDCGNVALREVTSRVLKVSRPQPQLFGGGDMPGGRGELKSGVRTYSPFYAHRNKKGPAIRWTDCFRLTTTGVRLCSVPQGST